MNEAGVLVVLLLAVGALKQYVFRFQRTTLGISRVLGQGGASIAILLTPNWMGLLGWVSTVATIALSSWAMLAFGWIGAVGVLVSSFVLVPVLDLVSPLPTYRHCFDIAEGSLRSHPHPASVAEVLDGIRSIRHSQGC